jgi:hypothetical protein
MTIATSWGNPVLLIIRWKGRNTKLNLSIGLLKIFYWLPAAISP